MSLNSIRYCDPGNAEEDKAEHPVQKESMLLIALIRGRGQSLQKSTNGLFRKSYRNPCYLIMIPSTVQKIMSELVIHVCVCVYNYKYILIVETVIIIL